MTVVERELIAPRREKSSPQSYIEQRLAALKKRGFYYFGNGVDLVFDHDPKNPLAAKYKEACFRRLATRESGIMLASGIIDLYYTDQRFYESGRSDTFHFNIIKLSPRKARYVLVGSGESKSGKVTLETLCEELGKESAFLERVSQKKGEVLFLLQNTVPENFPYPTEVGINPTEEISVNFLCNEKIPGIKADIGKRVEIGDPKGRFKAVTYEHFPLLN